MSPQKWIRETNAIGIILKSGKYGGGTFARSDIAFEFIVFDDNTIDCPTLGLQDYNYIELKPRFELHGHKVDEELFDYLKQNGMIRYSNDMVYLYGFIDTKGYDSNPRHYGVGSPYKWAKKKGPILVKQRKGQLN